jgi:hypothetical protein
MNPRAPVAVAEQLPGLLHIPPFIDELKHQPHLVGHARHTPFPGHRLPLVGLLFRPVHSVLEPHPPCPFQLIALSGINPALRLLNLVARLHKILDDVKLIVHHPSVPEVGAHSLVVGGAHIDARVLDGFGMPVVPQQFPSKCLPNRGILAGGGEEDSLGHQIGKHRQLIVSLAPVHLVGTHPSHVLGAQPLIRRLHVGGEHPPHARVALAEDLTGTLHRHLPHEGQGECLEVLSAVLAAPLPGRGHSVHRAVVPTAAAGQREQDDAILVEDVQMAPLQRFDVVIAGHRGSCPRTLLRPQVRRFLHFQHERRGVRVKPCLHHTPGLTQPQQLSKRLLRCHRQRSSATRQATPPHWE